ncbi:MAG TPA: insulinase family protein, partial [Thioploca sp.]|nr:insulinase family protein [Thioploca sp.]
MLYKSLRLSVLGLLCYSSASLMAGEVHEFTLDNGLHLIVKEDHRAPVVVSQVWYKVGASYEQEGKTGLSHMLEHMMFKGTEKYPAGEFSRIMAVNGARENAFTGTDFTTYFQTLEKSRLSLSFEMEADRMRHLVLTEEEFAKEREVVTEERRMRVEDRPIGQTREHFKATAYQTSPYQNPIIGWMSDLKNYTLADLQAWYQRWYAPNNAIVVVVGDVEPQAVLA